MGFKQEGSRGLITQLGRCGGSAHPHPTRLPLRPQGLWPEAASSHSGIREKAGWSAEAPSALKMHPKPVGADSQQARWLRWGRGALGTLQPQPCPDAAKQSLQKDPLISPTQPHTSGNRPKGATERTTGDTAGEFWEGRGGKLLKAWREMRPRDRPSE